MLLQIEFDWYDEADIYAGYHQFQLVFGEISKIHIITQKYLKNEP